MPCGIQLFQKISCISSEYCFSTDLCVAFCIWQDIHKFYIKPLLLRWFVHAICFRCPTFIEVLWVYTSNSFLVFKDLHGLNLAEVSVLLDKLLLAGAAITAVPDRVIWRKCQYCWPLHPWKAIFLEECKSALRLLLVIHYAIWKNDGGWMKTDLRLASCLCWNILCHFEKRIV